MKSLGLFVSAVAVVAATGSPAAAASITFNLGNQLVSANAGDNIPSSASLPSVGFLTFTDVGPQTVELWVRANLEASNEYLQLVLFNGSTGSDATHPRNQDLAFSLGATTGTFSAPVLTKSNDAMTLNPNGGFDFKIAFGSNTAANRFDGTDSVRYTITCGVASSCGAGGFNPLDALDFNVLNAVNANPNYNGWFGIAAVGYLAPGTTGDSNGARYGDNIGADNLQAVAAVPEPASLLMLGSGVVALFARKRRAASR